MIHGETYLTLIIAARGIMLNAWGREKINPSNTTAASGIAGGIAGFAGGLLRMTNHPISLLPFLTSIRRA
jgi:hypothetical protein